MVAFVEYDLKPTETTGNVIESYKVECVCLYCGKPLINRQALRAHLKQCVKRNLMRYYVVNEFIIGIFCNPGKYLTSIEAEIKGSGDPKLVLGSIRSFHFLKKIKSFFIIDLKHRNDNNALYSNGTILYNDLIAKMTEQEIQQIRSERATITQPHEQAGVISAPAPATITS
jgi:hypothetical protein